MSNRQNMTPLIIALVLAVLAGIATFYYLSNTSADAQNSAAAQLTKLGTQLDVVVPNANISPGSPISSDNLSVVKRYLADIQGLDVITSPVAIVGKYASAWLYQGEPILSERITASAGQTQVADLPSKQVPSQKLGFALSINPEQAVGGLIGKGDKIDIYSSKVGTSTLVFASVDVLCVAGQFPCGGSISTSATTNPNAGFGGSANTISGGVQTGSKILILDIDDSQVATLTGLLTSGNQIYVALHSSKQ